MTDRTGQIGERRSKFIVGVRRLVGALIIFHLSMGSATAQPFLELGAGAAIGGCLANGWRYQIDHAERPGSAARWRFGQQCSSNPLGLLAVGYRRGEWEIRLDHWSSVVPGEAGYDRGVEILSLRRRWEWK